MHVKDCIYEMIFAVKNSNEKVSIFNISSEDIIPVIDIAKIVSKKINLNPEFKFTGAERGWKGRHTENTIKHR